MFVLPPRPRRRHGARRVVRGQVYAFPRPRATSRTQSSAPLGRALRASRGDLATGRLGLHPRVRLLDHVADVALLRIVVVLVPAQLDLLDHVARADAVHVVEGEPAAGTDAGFGLGKFILAFREEFC